MSTYSEIEYNVNVKQKFDVKKYSKEELNKIMEEWMEEMRLANLLDKDADDWVNASDSEVCNV